ncbi:peptidoglycan editing factor PgeF [Halalkalibacillus sediminis]|nr:peptidoglycan editing factor PgeF [Halalkalibacillus sediminis]
MKSEIFKLKDTHYLQIEDWERDGIIAGFSTRDGGFSESPYTSLNLGIHVNDKHDAVVQNRQKFNNTFHKSFAQWKCLNQVHSNLVIDFSDDETPLRHDQPAIDADGMITNRKDHFLAMFYADCVPLFFRVKNTSLIGLAHAGWQGTVQGIGTVMADKLLSHGVSLEDVEVIIGPCISSTNYEVDEKVVQQIPAKFHNQVLEATSPGHFLLDLRKLNQLILTEYGFDKDQIRTTSYCTFDQQELFFSHRRDQGHTGRMMAFMFIDN